MYVEQFGPQVSERISAILVVAGAAAPTPSLPIQVTHDEFKLTQEAVSWWVIVVVIFMIIAASLLVFRMWRGSGSSSSR